MSNSAADRARHQSIKLAFFEEYERNGGNATLAAYAVGATPGNGRKWVIKRNARLAQAMPKAPRKQTVSRTTAKQVLEEMEKKYGHVVFKKSASRPRLHVVIPDVQIEPEDDTEFLEWVGEHILMRRPDVIICIGDFADMKSLSSYDKGKLAADGKRYKLDIEASKSAMKRLLKAITEWNRTAAILGLPLYNPEMYYFEGNHEHRISRYVNEHPEMEGFMKFEDLEFESFGWKVIRFLQVGVIDGIAYSHYFQNPGTSNAIASAVALLNKLHCSIAVGHNQKDAVAHAVRADGKRITCVMVGACNEKNEGYLGPQGNFYFRGIWYFHDVFDMEYSPEPVELKRVIREAKAHKAAKAALAI